MISYLRRLSLFGLRRLDRGFNRLYGWRYNPLYQTGTLVVLLLIILLLTGIYLLLFYRVGSPWGSVADITAQPWGGRWIRTLHRYASDAAIVAIVVHAVRMFAQGRSWGPRALAWISGVVLTGVFLVCGWTGYVMIWDVQAQALAVEGAKLLDVLPIFSEPIGRTFADPEPLPGAFFFMNLFLHIVLPIGLGIILWLHVSRIARPALMPPRALAWGATALLIAVSVVWPIGMAERADALRLPGETPLDVFYAFWLPLSRIVPGWVGWLVIGFGAAVALLIPRWTRPAAASRPPPSTVDPRLCTECFQCSVDCPYEAIRMIPRQDGRFDLVADVDPALCVSCGICAGSCKPMGIGPPGRSGRDQLARVREFLTRESPSGSEIVIVACDRSADWLAASSVAPGLAHHVGCAGSLHTSAVELMIRRGVGGVAIVACPPRDCWNREGATWLDARVSEGREAELLPRVDRRRVRILNAAEPGLVASLERFAREIRDRAPASAEHGVELDLACEPTAEPLRGAQPEVSR